MTKKSLLLIFSCCVLFFSCDPNKDYSVLEDYINSTNSKFSSVIACAASTNESVAEGKVINAFFYPRDGATNFQIFQTESIEADFMDYSLYEKLDLSSQPVFGGKLRKFDFEQIGEKYMIITFEENDTLHISDPIKSRYKADPTVWEHEITIDDSNSLMPRFIWEEVQDAVIYFQVVSTSSDQFISGTYTETTFYTYLDYINVILDINTEKPQPLVIDDSYQFTLMSVTDDNWVMQVGEKEFVAK